MRREEVQWQEHANRPQPSNRSSSAPSVAAHSHVPQRWARIADKHTESPEPHRAPALRADALNRQPTHRRDRAAPAPDRAAGQVLPALAPARRVMDSAVRAQRTGMRCFGRSSRMGSRQAKTSFAQSTPGSTRPNDSRDWRKPIGGGPGYGHQEADSSASGSGCRDGLKFGAQLPQWRATAAPVRRAYARAC
jgi:hypothetical protein